MKPAERRILSQRLRNRLIESVEILAEGEAAMHEVGPAEWFEIFYDSVPHRDHRRPAGPVHLGALLTDAETVAIAKLSALVDDACDAMLSRTVTIEEFVASGWEGRIRDEASVVAGLLNVVGRLDEDAEDPRL